MVTTVRVLTVVGITLFCLDYHTSSLMDEQASLLLLPRPHITLLTTASVLLLKLN